MVKSWFVHNKWHHSRSLWATLFFIFLADEREESRGKEAIGEPEGFTEKVLQIELDKLMKEKSDLKNELEELKATGTCEDHMGLRVCQRKKQSIEQSKVLWVTAFPRISAHALIGDLPQINAHPLGHNVKQELPSIKTPSPPLPSLFAFLNRRDTRKTFYSCHFI